MSENAYHMSDSERAELYVKRFGREKIAAKIAEIQADIARNTELQKGKNATQRRYYETLKGFAAAQLPVWQKALELCKDSSLKAKAESPRKKKQKTFYKRDLKKIAEILAEQGESIRLLNLKKG